MQKNKTLKKIAIFISDEGFGHTVRQRSIIEELLKTNKNFSIEVITSSKILLLKEKFGSKISYYCYHNLIETQKNKDGSLNLKKTLKMFKNWSIKKENWIKKMITKYKNYDLIISDGVPQAFILSKLLNIQSLNISYFTWDWFFKIHYLKKKNKKCNEIFKLIRDCYLNCDHFLTLPFTPINKRVYQNSVFSKIDLVVDKNICRRAQGQRKKINCLIMDNGTQTMRSLINKSLPYLSKLKNITFFIGSKSFESTSKKNLSLYKNLLPVFGLKKMHKKISECNFLIGRAGYNTISESLFLSKPTILFYEHGNYETLYNLNLLIKKKLASKILKKDFGKNIINRINKFLLKEKKLIESRFKNFSYTRKGSLQAKKIIINKLKLL